MSVRSPIIRDGMYRGTITDAHASGILRVRESKEIAGMKHMVFDFPLELVERSIREEKSIRKIVREEGIDYRKYLGTLRSYQTVGAAFMYMSPRSMIADGVGLGKTIEIAAVLNYLRGKGQMRRFLMAVENSAISQTQYELTRFTGMRIVALSGESKHMQKEIDTIDWNDVQGIIIKHSSLKSDSLYRWLAKYAKDDMTNGMYDVFILDESSVIKNDKTKTYQYTKNLCAYADRVHFMNATAFDKNIMDIYYQIDMMDENLLPKRWRIEQDFCNHSSKLYWAKGLREDGKWGGIQKTARSISSYKNQDAFRRLLQLVYFGRCKKDVGLDRPNIYKVYEVEPTAAQLNAIKAGYRYNEVLNSPSCIEELKIKDSASTVPKIARVCSLLENDFADSSVMIYCFHIAAQKALKRELDARGRRCVILNGEDSSKDKDANRAKIISDFNNGVYDTIITNIKKSLNLHGGDVCIFYSMSTTVSSMEQIRGRIDRNVDDRVKTFILLLYAGTDEYRFFTDTVKNRAKSARELTVDAETAIDYFIESMKGDRNEAE